MSSFINPLRHFLEKNKSDALEEHDGKVSNYECDLPMKFAFLRCSVHGKQLWSCRDGLFT